MNAADLHADALVIDGHNDMVVSHQIKGTPNLSGGHSWPTA